MRFSVTANLELASTRAPEPLSTVRQLELLRDLQRLANDRAREEVRVSTALAEGLTSAVELRDKTAREIEQQYRDIRKRATTENETATAEARRRYDTERDAAQNEYKGLRKGVESEHSRVTEAARSEQQEVSWETLTVFEAVKGRPKERLLEAVKRLERHTRELAVLEHDAMLVMKLRRQWREFPPLEALAVGAAPSAAGNGDG